MLNYFFVSISRSPQATDRAQFVCVFVLWMLLDVSRLFVKAQFIVKHFHDPPPNNIALPPIGLFQTACDSPHVTFLQLQVTRQT